MSASHLKGLDISLFCGIGSGTPPDGTKANLVDPPTLGPAAWGITITMTVWALLFTMARVYVNFRKLKASDCKFPPSVDTTRVERRKLTLLTIPDFVIIAMALDIVYGASVLLCMYFERITIRFVTPWLWF